jgi:prepilin-type N-terminal cleavage/methylation domain-containing protein
MNRPGFTLLECLIGLALSLVIITAGLGFYASAQRTFVRLQAREEAGQAALAALDKMKIDLLHAGRGLAPEIALGLVAPVETVAGELRLTASEKTLALEAGASAGATRLTLRSTADVTSGRRILLRQGEAGEVRTVTRVEAGSVVVEAPLERAYDPGSAAVSLLELVAYYRDGVSRILRRRANASSAQPVVEGVAAADWSLDPAANLVRLRLELDVQGVHPHEATVFLKNPALTAQFGR